MRHLLAARIAGALPRPRPAEATRFLVLLDRRLRAVEAVARGHAGATRLRLDGPSRALVRRVLRRFERTWDDGDENLVRGYLDRWSRPGEDPVRSLALSLAQTALALAAIEARPGVFWFFLWEMESMLALPSDLARMPGHLKQARALRGGR